MTDTRGVRAHLPLLIPLGFMLFLKWFEVFLPYFNHDEVTNSLFANMILDGRMGLHDFLGNTYILTHYLYVWITQIFGKNQIWAVHFVHTLWCLGTTAAMYAAGRELTRSKTGGCLAAMFYAAISVTFMSKDFRAALAESFSLLPGTLAVFFHFKGSRRPRDAFFFLAGFFSGLAGLAKAPALIVVTAIFVALLLSGGSKRLRHFLFVTLGTLCAVSLPLVLYGNPWDAFLQAQRLLEETRKYYITAYDDLPVLYWVFKYLLRTVMIAACGPLVWYLAYTTIRRELITAPRVTDPIFRSHVLLLIVWFLASWFTVSLGKRVFYHYFVFLLPSVSLLAAPAGLILWNTLKSTPDRVRKLWVLACVFFIPPVGFGVEAIMGWSVLRKDYSAVVRHVRATTREGERIYVWGLVPQIYYDSNRDPATTFFWSDTLAGVSPGSPAMEYMNASGVKLGLLQSMRKDMSGHPNHKITSPRDVTKQKLDTLFYHDLLTDAEILEGISNPFWRRVFEDFMEQPPELFIDTSPTGIRGFSSYPLEKYELFKRFLLQNYVYDRVIDRMVIYRLKR